MPQRLLYCHHIVICHLQFGWKERLWKHPMFKITLNVQIEETLPSRHCWVLAAVNSFCFFNSLFSVVNCPPLLVIPGHFTSWATCCCYTEMYAFFCKKGKSCDWKLTWERGSYTRNTGLFLGRVSSGKHNFRKEFIWNWGPESWSLGKSLCVLVWRPLVYTCFFYWLLKIHPNCTSVPTGHWTCFNNGHQ